MGHVNEKIEVLTCTFLWHLIHTGEITKADFLVERKESNWR